MFGTVGDGDGTWACATPATPESAAARSPSRPRRDATGGVGKESPRDPLGEASGAAGYHEARAPSHMVDGRWPPPRRAPNCFPLPEASPSSFSLAGPPVARRKRTSPPPRAHAPATT